MPSSITSVSLAAYSNGVDAGPWPLPALAQFISWLVGDARQRVRRVPTDSSSDVGSRRGLQAVGVVDHLAPGADEDRAAFGVELRLAEFDGWAA